jgi:RHS repeat-associated protein
LGLGGSDYYPFGMELPGRTYSSGNQYRYGFNGKEKDTEGPVQYDYGFRIYDPRLVRFKSLDPLQHKFPELTPYQFASNRPIDGIDLDGREYITFHVIVTKAADGTPSFKKYIAADFRGLPGGVMAAIHNNKDYTKNFYKYYSESFGAEGRGFKWIYFDEKGNQLGDPVWQMKQSKSLYAATDEYSGYYSGGGSITKFGPGLSNGRYSELNNDYDFSYRPMSYADAISKSHDMMQEKEIVQPQGWLEDVRTLKSDKILLSRAETGVFETLGEEYSREDFLRTSKIVTFFSAVVRYKNWKVGEMQKQGLDINSAADQRKVILSDWKPKFLSKDWFAKRLMSASGGGATESQRNTVKPVEKKKP